VGQVLTATSGSATASIKRAGVRYYNWRYAIWNGRWVVVAATVNEAATLQMIGGVPT
jgi:hypothetical protein